MDSLCIRPYQGTDESEVLRLWQASLTHDPITAATWRTKVLLDPNFAAEGLLVAEGPGRLDGFVLSLARQVPLFLQGLEPDVGWITAFGVDPRCRRQGTGRRLFDAALERLASLGRKRVLISPYTPNYFTPGVDVAAYPEAVSFLQATGWQTTSTPLSMQVDLTGFQVPPEIEERRQALAAEGIDVRPLQPSDLPLLMPFIVRHFGWEWFRHAQEYLTEVLGRGADDISFFVALQRGEIVGYCQQRRERFGPFGVAKEMRGKGVGRVLLFQCLAAAPAKGFHCAWFLWTSDETARLYSLAGFKPVRRFAVMRKTIGP